MLKAGDKVRIEELNATGVVFKNMVGILAVRTESGNILAIGDVEKGLAYTSPFSPAYTLSLIKDDKALKPWSFKTNAKVLLDEVAQGLSRTNPFALVELSSGETQLVLYQPVAELICSTENIAITHISELPDILADLRVKIKRATRLEKPGEITVKVSYPKL